MKNNENGRSMVEMLGVLAIIGVLSAGGLAGYSKAMFKHKLNNTMDQITMLVTNIRTMYGTQRTYAGLSNYKAYQLGIVPAVMVSGTPAENSTTLTNPFKGKVTILPAASKATDTAKTGAFVIGYEKLPKEACIALATADFGTGAGSGFVGVNILAANTAITKEDQSTVKVGAGTDGRAEGSAYTMENAISGCQEMSSIIWKFY